MRHHLLSLTLCIAAAGLLFAATANGQTTLNPAGKVAACPTALPGGSDGWDVKVYTNVANWNNRLFAAAYGLEAAMKAGSPAGHSTAEPDINFENMDGCNGNVVGERQVPGLDGGTDVNYYGMVMTGWIAFPQAKTYTLNVSSDDGFSCVIGTGTTNQVVGYFDGGRGCGAGTDFAVTVVDPGVYAIQIIMWEGEGGSGVEFTRHENDVFTLVGTTRPEGMADQPLIYAATNGLPAVRTDVTASIPGTKLNSGGKVAACPATLPVAGSDGWTVAVYTGLNNQLNNNRLAYAAYDLNTAANAGPPQGLDQNQPDLNYMDANGCAGHIAGERQLPFVNNSDDFGAVVTGWICFPEARVYTFVVSSDDGFSCVIGAGSTNQVIGYFDGGRGCDDGTFFTVSVPAAGIYPFQMIYWEGGGGAGFELTRFVNNGFTLVGTTRPDGMPDQPVIYGAGSGPGQPPVNILASIPAFDPGPTVYLDKKGAEADAAGLSGPGWDVATYPVFNTTGDLATAKGSLAFDYAYNFIYSGGFVPEPYLNFNNNGGNACVMIDDVPFPGLPCNGGDRGQEYFASVSKGWIQFPPDTDGTNPYPRAYALNLNSDDGFEVLFGTGTTNQVVKSFTAGRGCGNETDPATTFNLLVQEAGVYAIQIIHWDGEWGGNLEFFRRKADADPRLTQKILVGAAGTGDQPLVFGLKNGKPAPDLLATYTSNIGIIPNVQVNLDPVEKIGDASVVSGQSGFNIKLVKARIPNVGIGYAAWDDGRATALSFLEFLDNQVPGATSATVNYVDAGNPIGGAWIGCEVPFPSNSAAEDNFAVRADGFAVFAEAGLYYLGIDIDDDGYIRFGNQTVFATGCCPNQIIPLNVTQPGTYPVRVEFVEYGGDARFKFYELAPGGGRVAVNGAGSRIKVYTAAAVTPDIKPSWQGWTIPADRKVANLGQGGTLGWSAIAAKVPGGLNLDEADSYNSLAMGTGLMGVASAIAENNLASLPGVALPQATDAPPFINVETGGEFFAGNTTAGQVVADLPLSRFLYPDNSKIFPTGGDAEQDFVLSFSGYIEFPAAGEYGFNCNNNSGAAVWIAGQVVTEFPFTSWSGENTPGWVKITEPGIYDIRVDYFEGTDNADASQNSNQLEIVQYLPNSTRKLINDPDNTPGTVKVYRTLAATPATTLYHSPGWLPASAKIGAIDRGGTPGARVQVVNAVFVTGNGDGGIGQDKFRTSQECHEMLAAVLDGVHSGNQHGTLASDTVMATVNLQATTDFPGANEEDFAVRVTGVLALTKGGHVFEVASDDGMVMTMAGKVVGMSGALQGTNACSFYVKAEEDGLYPFTLEYHERGGGNQLLFFELVAGVDPTSGALTLTRELVNNGIAAKMYVGLSPCPYPFADSDRDGDVDQMDFAAFQLCFTGVPTVGEPPVIPESCACFNRNNDAFIDALDFATFQNCYTGPAVPWTPTNPGPPCVP